MARLIPLLYICLELCAIARCRDRLDPLCGRVYSERIGTVGPGDLGDWPVIFPPQERVMGKSKRGAKGAGFDYFRRRARASNL